MAYELRGTRGSLIVVSTDVFGLNIYTRLENIYIPNLLVPNSYMGGTRTETYEQ